MAASEIYNALAENRKTWLAGLGAGSKLIFVNYATKVVAVESVTKTMLILGNGGRVSRKTGKVVGGDSKHVKQLLTCSPQFQPGTEFDVGHILTRFEARMVAECVLEMAGVAA